MNVCCFLRLFRFGVTDEPARHTQESARRRAGRRAHEAWPPLGPTGTAPMGPTLEPRFDRPTENLDRNITLVRRRWPSPSKGTQKARSRGPERRILLAFAADIGRARGGKRKKTGTLALWKRFDVPARRGGQFSGLASGLAQTHRLTHTRTSRLNGTVVCGLTTGLARPGGTDSVQIGTAPPLAGHVSMLP